MANPEGRLMSVGDTINEARVRNRLGLRALARELNIAPSYLSDIENDRRVPSETVLRDMSRVLELDFDKLMQEAGRLGKGEEQYFLENELAGRLFRRIARSHLDQEALEKLMSSLEELENPGEDDEGIP